ncbi:MAG: hypothetical protein V4516_14710 [Pseudomonadota bacterium]
MLYPVAESADAKRTTGTSGLHHFTGIAANVQANVDFHVGFVGLKQVKRTDGCADAEQLRLICGDSLGSPGSLLTILPWEPTGHGRIGIGIGQVSEVAVAVSPVSIGDWLTKSLAANVSFVDHPASSESRFYS